MRGLRLTSTPKQKLRQDCQKSTTSVMHPEISAWRQKLLLAAVECLSLVVAWEKFIKSHKAVSQTWLIALWLALTDNHRLVMQCHPLSPPSNGWDRRWERGVLIAAVIFNKDKLFVCIPPLLFGCTLPRCAPCQPERWAAARCVGTISYTFHSSDVPTDGTGPGQITWWVHACTPSRENARLCDYIYKYEYAFMETEFI